jgi:hypothetical protein
VQLGHYLALLHRSQKHLAGSFRAVADAHADDAAIRRAGQRFAIQCERHREQLEPFVSGYAADAEDPPADLHSDRFQGPRGGPLGLLRDLHDLYVITAECDVMWTLIGQAAQGARDRDLLDTVRDCEGETTVQMQWLKTQMKQAAPQTLVVIR